MLRYKKSLIDRLSLGYSFGKEREALSLVAISYFLIILFGAVIILLHLNEHDLIPVTYRYHAIILIGLLNLWLLRKHLINPARILTLVMIPFLLLILPPLAGVSSDEFYFWFPYVPIGLSIIPHFILHPIRQRIQLYISLVAYICMSIFIDSYLIFLSDGSEQIIPFVIENRFYYRLIPVFLFLFVNGTLRLLIVKNHQFKTIMESQQQELLQSEKMASLGILISGLAHEINNPLNFITGSLNALNTLKTKYKQAGSKNPAEREKVLTQIDKVIDSAFEGVDRASNIISKLELFANPDVKEKKEIINLDNLIQTVLRSIESRLPYYIDLTIDIPGDLKVQCHTHQLRLVFTHILRNAIDALESREVKGRGTIDVSAARESIDHRPYTKISFCNSGPAIPDQDIKHIFDPFFSSREVGEGLGLGMSLSYMIIKKHGGKLEVKNENGIVRFDIFLPAWVEGLSIANGSAS